MNNVEDFLEHFGVKGMRWGVRNDRSGGTSNKVNRDAKKDAREFARAKVYYGEGSGTRRKLIKTKVEAKSKRIPGYKEAFESHLTNQDLSKHVSKAVSERKRTDRVQTNKKRFGAVARRLTGEMGTQAALVALVFSGVTFAKSQKGQQVMKTSMNKIRKASEEFKRRQGAKNISDFINRQT